MKVLIFILSYNAERHIRSVFDDIPDTYRNNPDVEILLIDDASKDATVDVARAHINQIGLTNARVMKNAHNQGYGGNQKVGYTYAIRQGFDVVVMLHGDNQYTPKALPELLTPFETDLQVGCVLGVRFGRRYSPLRGGMPLYKYVGNRILTTLQNRLAGVQLSEWHTGYRAYSTRALSTLGFALNTNDFHFDTEILLQLVQNRIKIVEINVPTHYGGEICHVNGMRYAKNVMKGTFKFFLQKYHLFYDVRFHPEVVYENWAGEGGAGGYEQKLDSCSPHSLVCRDPDLIPEGSEVLDIGCSSGYVGRELHRRRNCRVTGVDVLPPYEVTAELERYAQIDLEKEEHRLISLIEDGDFDAILMLDVVEHLSQPERLLLRLSSIPYGRTPRFVFSTGNVGFFVVRLMLLLGHFNYGQRGILDVTHRRLFSAHTFRSLMEQTGFLVRRQIYIPFPFQALGFSGRLAKFLESVNMALIRLRPRLFAYQMLLETVPLVTPAAVLDETVKSQAEATPAGAASPKN
ncbi:MAG TPA: bifunctional glycosyltransferase/class I SAM-dependent methyltransferase [Terriglobia bacterium]|nr:bifunctional glycosyltransferase/class I SAM-dependent methyltransferase [Terriglobia bacterium]